MVSDETLLVTHARVVKSLMVSHETLRGTRARMVTTRRRIAESQDLIFHSRVLMGGGHPVVGGSSGGTPNGCTHDVAWFESRRPYAEACEERDQFAAEFAGRFVSAVERGPSGFWGWRFCALCAA